MVCSEALFQNRLSYTKIKRITKALTPYFLSEFSKQLTSLIVGFDAKRFCFSFSFFFFVFWHIFNKKEQVLEYGDYFCIFEGNFRTPGLSCGSGYDDLTDLEKTKFKRAQLMRFLNKNITNETGIGKKWQLRSSRS